MGKIALHWQILAGMLLGATIGLTLNFTVSEATSEVPAENLPAGIRQVTIHDSSDLIKIDITDEDNNTQHVVVDGTRRSFDSVATLSELENKHPREYDWFQSHGRSWSRWVGDISQRLGGLFLRMLRMVAVPLIVTSLVTGVMGLGHAERLGRMFSRTLAYYLTTSMLAIITGLTMVNLIRPGLDDNVHKQTVAEIQKAVNLGEVLFGQVETMIPSNPIGALAEGNFLSIICFSLAFAIFALIVGGKTA
ncbi:MAG: cation:dicarboxylase symporter family transporter, partial [Pirellulaceae bacterium]|nr:cation:dicarboxylase symporter family transporter [Pirellulaceae bacterium]